MSEKFTAYFLLIAGIIVIVLSSFQIYRVFTGRVRPFSLFRLSGLTIQIPQAPSGQMELLRGSDLTAIADLSAYYFLMSFFLNVGFKVSSLGIQLLRPIVVNPGATEP